MRFQIAARSLAITLALLGAIDPAWPATTPAPRVVELRATSDAAAAAVKPELERILKGEVTFASAEAPAARVIVGGVPDAEPGGIPTSFVSLDSKEYPNTRIAAVTEPRAGIVGWRTAVAATIEGRGVAGSVSTLVVEQNGIALGRVEHRWTRADERADVAIPFVPASEGAARLTLRLGPVAGEHTTDDNVADVRNVARARRLRVLVHEPRPSWTASFVRRVLESNPVFDVSAAVLASKGLTVRAGMPPANLGHVDDFDVVIAGVPEQLTSSEVDALEGFARRRGGSVVIVPDRRPSGVYARLLPGREFDEVLLEKPIAARTIDGALQASELVLPGSPVPSADVLASIERNGKVTPLVFSMPLGGGRVVFSGAMDAWRFRAVEDQTETFARFWTGAIAGAALAAPSKLELSAAPGIVKPGDAVDVTLRLRRSELAGNGDRAHVPAVQARLISASGTQEVIRLWPTGDPGSFAGRVRIPESGKYDLQASTGALTADEVVIAAADARRPDDADVRRQTIARSTGGVVVSVRDLAPLAESLRALPAPRDVLDRRPTRSVWFVVAFAAVLCVEWTMRRRTALR